MYTYARQSALRQLLSHTPVTHTHTHILSLFLSLSLSHTHRHYTYICVCERESERKKKSKTVPVRRSEEHSQLQCSYICSWAMFTNDTLQVLCQCVVHAALRLQHSIRMRRLPVVLRTWATWPLLAASGSATLACVRSIKFIYICLYIYLCIYIHIYVYTRKSSRTH